MQWLEECNHQQDVMMCCCGPARISRAGGDMERVVVPGEVEAGPCNVPVEDGAA